MIQPLRKFSIFVTAGYKTFTPGKSYTVLALDQTEDDMTIHALVVDDEGDMEWLHTGEFKVASIDD